jgi:putative redox protein
VLICGSQEIKVTYELTGKDLNHDSIRKAVNLSEERYCGVSHMLKKALNVSSQIVVNGEVI